MHDQVCWFHILSHGEDDDLPHCVTHPASVAILGLYEGREQLRIYACAEHAAEVQLGLSSSIITPLEQKKDGQQ